MSSSLFDPIAFLEHKFGLQFKRVSSDEFSSSCPWCGGEDRFRVWTTGNYWCRPGPGHCGQKGWIDKLTGQERITTEQRMEMRLRRLEAAQKETERRVSALERMAHCQDHRIYHKALTDEAREWWYQEGINDDSIQRYKLGYCPRCPTDRDGRSSYTIPVINGGQLLNIRHRLKTTSNGDKYRPHMAGLGTQLFNADFLQGARETIVLEGSKKSIVLDQQGLGNVAIMGKRAFKREWLEWFSDIGTIYVALDPDAKESAARLAAIFGNRGRIVNLPVKPDDFFTIYGGTVDEFADFLTLAKPTK